MTDLVPRKDAVRDIVTRKAALTRLAIATKHKIPGTATQEERESRDAFFAVFLNDPALSGFSTETFVRGCSRCENAHDYFPTKHQLIEACKAHLAYRASLQKPALALPAGEKPLAPERLKTLLADIKAHIRSKVGMK